MLYMDENEVCEDQSKYYVTVGNSGLIKFKYPLLQNVNMAEI
jgi:hypothetical protein